MPGNLHAIGCRGKLLMQLFVNHELCRVIAFIGIWDRVHFDLFTVDDLADYFRDVTSAI